MQTPWIPLLALFALPSCLTIEVHLPLDLGQTRTAAAGSAAVAAGSDSTPGLSTITIDEASLSTAKNSPSKAFGNEARYRGTVLLRMGHHPDFELVKDFMSRADQTFELRFDGGEPIRGEVGVGGITVSGVSYAIWRPSGQGAAPESADQIQVRALNEGGGRRWTVSPLLASR